MPNKTLFQKRASGFSGQSIDFWYLISKDNGSFFVEHNWLHPRGGKDVDAGNETLSVDKIFADGDEELCRSLRIALAKAVS